MRKLSMAVCLLLVGAGLGAGAFWLGMRPRSSPNPADSDASESAPAEPPRLTRTPEGETVIRCTAETQRRVGLKVERVVAVTRRPEVAAYGLLQEDPVQSFTLRAPLAGVLRAAERSTWPDFNQRLEAGAPLGYVEPRLTQTERIDLAARLTQARADAAEAEAALAAARSSYENKRRLNAEDKAVSDRAVEEAEAKVKGEEARRDAALQIVHLIESAGSADSDPDSRFELRVEQAGEVTDVLVRPGEAVEAGQILLRIARFDALVARVELPVGQRFDEAAPTAQILPVGQEEYVLTGQRLGLATATEYSAGHGPILLYRVPISGTALRPGAAVVARVPAPGGTRSGVAIPRKAVVRLLGKTWAYVQTGEELFTRRELSEAESTGDAWFATRGFQPGDSVVTDGAQVLLSEELKAQIEREEAAAE